MRSIIFSILFLTIQSVWSQVPQKPKPIRFYNDLSGTEFLTPQESQEIERKLRNFEKKTSNEIIVVIVNDLNNLEPADFALQIGSKWGVGKKKENNGIVLLIKPSSVGFRKVKGKTFLSIGRGLEGIIPDATAKRIVDYEINPEFKSKEFYSGVNNGLNVLMSLAKKEYNFADYEESTIVWYRTIFQILFACGFLIYLIGWLFYGIDPKRGKKEMLQNPPLDLSPALVNSIMNQSYIGVDLFKNALLSLAEKGIVRIKYYKLTNTKIELIKNYENSNIAISNEELSLLKSLFSENNTYELPTKFNGKLFKYINDLTKEFETSNGNLFFITNIGFTMFGFLIHLVSIYFFYQTYGLGWSILYFLALFVVGAIMAKLINKYTKLGREKMDEIEGFVRYIKQSDFESLYQSNSHDKMSLHNNFSYAYAVNQIDNWINHYKFLNQKDKLKYNLDFLEFEDEELTDQNLKIILKSINDDIASSIKKDRNTSRNSVLGVGYYNNSSSSSYSSGSTGDFGGGDFGGGGAGGDW